MSFCSLSGSTSACDRPSTPQSGGRERGGQARRSGSVRAGAGCSGAARCMWGGGGGHLASRGEAGESLPRRALPGVKFTTRVRGRRQIYYTCNTDCNGKRERECCLLVLNLVSSTLSCIRRPLFTATSRPRPRGWMKGPFIQPIQGPRRHETPFRKRKSLLPFAESRFSQPLYQ